MTLFVDARVPVILDGTLDDGDALLAEHGLVLPAGTMPDAWFEVSAAFHQPGCACCVARSPAAMALAGLFAARARGDVPFFRRVVVLAGEAGLAELRAVLEGDPLVTARYRLAGHSRP